MRGETASTSPDLRVWGPASGEQRGDLVARSSRIERLSDPACGPFGFTSASRYHLGQSRWLPQLVSPPGHRVGNRSTRVTTDVHAPSTSAALDSVFRAMEFTGDDLRRSVRHSSSAAMKINRHCPLCRNDESTHLLSTSNNSHSAWLHLSNSTTRSQMDSQSNLWLPSYMV